MVETVNSIEEQDEMQKQEEDLARNAEKIALEEEKKEEQFTITLSKTEKDIVLDSLNNDKDIETFIRSQKGAEKYKLLVDLTKLTQAKQG